MVPLETPNSLPFCKYPNLQICQIWYQTDIFDNHVFACHQNLELQRMEPEFLLFCLMACSDYNKLLSYERDLHLKNFDTTFKLTTTWTFFRFFHTLCQVLSNFRLFTLNTASCRSETQFSMIAKFLFKLKLRSFFSASSLANYCFIYLIRRNFRDKERQSPSRKIT